MLRFALLGAIVEQVDSWINLAVADFCIGGYVRVPLGRIAAHEVVALAWQWIDACCLGGGVSPDKLERDACGETSPWPSRRPESAWRLEIRCVRACCAIP